MTSKEIRSKFLAFFKSKSHAIVDSAPMILKNDPSLMFVNAGMVPFKEYFLGQKKVINKRVTDSQKCLRVSGKHNDLEEVGKDTYHHTMFEMLGNWSFGDYFKKEAIEWAWEFLTEELKIDKDLLYVTIFDGEASEGLERDNEAYDLWKEIIPEERIVNGNRADNFWEMGKQGPCGPCSEIHVDIRSKEDKAKIPGADLINQDHPQVVEIWNLVFMQFNRKANGDLEDLPMQHIDTGMGFERLCMVMQNVQSNYDTDVFIPIIKEVETITNNKYGVNEEVDIAIRVISDHVRAVAFAIADGQLPSNTGAGYVIRRILRRAVRYGFTFLNTKEPFIFKLVVVLAKQMGDYFPELRTQRQLITNVMKEEENSFLRTLDQGLILLDGIIKGTQGTEVSGKKAFELFDTYGFPIDLTALILSEKEMTLNVEEFEVELKKQKARSKAASVVETDDWVILYEDDDEEEFIGYDTLSAKIKITRYRKVTSKKDGDMYQLVFNMTPFYPEGGGQVGDKGYLEKSDGSTVYIVDTKKENNLIIHFSKTLPKNPTEFFNVVVDEKQRFRTACNHTATHLLHQALREVLGEHVEQKGSAVHSKHLRFDFSHFSKLTVDELTYVEDFVNARIENKLPLQEFRNIPKATAEEKGAMALFGEKYGDTVRAIQFGKSVELCGGTHVQNTSELWYFRIQSESAIASGIRRIEAITGDAMKTQFSENNRAIFQIKELVKNSKNPAETVLNIIEENNKLRKQIDQLLKEKAKGAASGLVDETELINGVNFLAKKLDLDQNSVKDLANNLGNKIENLFLVIGTESKGKAFLTCYISKNLVAEKQLNAGQIIKDLGKYIQGGGGGQAFFATAGGKNPEGISEALKVSKKYIE